MAFKGLGGRRRRFTKHPQKSKTKKMEAPRSMAPSPGGPLIAPVQRTPAPVGPLRTNPQGESFSPCKPKKKGGGPGELTSNPSPNAKKSGGKQQTAPGERGNPILGGNLSGGRNKGRGGDGGPPKTPFPGVWGLGKTRAALTGLGPGLQAPGRKVFGPKKGGEVGGFKTRDPKKGARAEAEAPGAKREGLGKKGKDEFPGSRV